LLLLVFELVHPATNPWSGAAQCVLQLSIAAPLFWVSAVVQSLEGAKRIIWLLFLVNAVSAGIGVLQVYYPDQFLPTSFSQVALSQNPEFVRSLTYVGADGKDIIRPPGLTDMPGGAALAGVGAGLLGILLAWQPRHVASRRLFFLAAAVVGFTAVYLCQVRSLLIVAGLSACTMGYLLIRQARQVEAALLISSVLGILVVSFLWAVAVGGDSVSARFDSVRQEGFLESYNRNRGFFVTNTFGELLFDYPLGAGVGRWGMMSNYFSRWDATPNSQLYVEIQVTGWLFDGGILMMVLYGGGVAAALAFAFRLAVTSSNRELAYLAAVVACLNLMVVAQCFAGPCFNTQMGIQFWVLAGALHGAYLAVKRQRLAARTLGREKLPVAVEPGPRELARALS
jgi:hypothetical protein